MSYQNVGTPRFYIDGGVYIDAVGGMAVSSSNEKRLFLLNPSWGNHDWTLDASAGGAEDKAFESYNTSSGTRPLLFSYNYVALLGHNFHKNLGAPNDNNANDYQNVYCSLKAENTPYGQGWAHVDPDIQQLASLSNVTYHANCDVSSFGFTPTKNGYCVVANAPENPFFDDINPEVPDNPAPYTTVQRVQRLLLRTINKSDYDANLRLSTMSAGWTYEMPFAPDLNLSLSYEYDGIKTTKTRGGATLTNRTWTHRPHWDIFQSWSDHPSSAETTVSRSFQNSGRRVWDLSFSYMSDSDLMPSQFIGNAGDDMLDYRGGSFGWGMMYNNFYTRVIAGTLGGSLPFIFQPDKDVEDFAIARFDMKSFKIEQTAPNLYNIKLKIRESW